jgi:hypothetical protein
MGSRRCAAGGAGGRVRRPAARVRTGSPAREDPDADESVADLHDLAERLAA